MLLEGGLCVALGVLLARALRQAGPAREGVFSSGTSLALDALRAVLTLLVVFSHTRAQLLESSDHLSHRPTFTWVFYLLSGFAEGAVLVFFVLSGYLIAHRYGPQLLQRKDSLRSFAKARALRLYMVLIPALVLAGLLALLRETNLRHPSIAGNARALLDARLIDGRDLLGNLSFLQPEHAGFFGENRPLWSLGYEAHCYVLFAALILLVRSGTPAWGRVLSASLLAVLLTVFQYLGRYASLWCLGALAAMWCSPSGPTTRPTRWYSRWHARWPRMTALTGALATLLCMIGLRALPRAGAQAEVFSFLLLGASASVFLGGLGRWDLERWDLERTPGFVSGLSPLARALSRSSYSTYLTHYPLLLSYRDLLERRELPATGAHLLEVSGVSFLLLGAGYLFSLSFEKHTASLRRRWIGPRRPSPANDLPTD